MASVNIKRLTWTGNVAATSASYFYFYNFTSAQGGVGGGNKLSVAHLHFDVVVLPALLHLLLELLRGEKRSGK